MDRLSSARGAAAAAGARLRLRLRAKYPVLVWLHRDEVSFGALAFIGVVAVVSLLAPLIAPYDPVEIDIFSRYAGVSTSGHLLGTDSLGRDILSRLLWGGRISLLVGIVPVSIATAISFALGMTAGYLGGRTDDMIMRILDVFFAFPMVLLALFLVGIAGPGILSVIGALTVVMIPYISRVVRTATVSEKEMDYVAAARASGASVYKILAQELLPNVIPPVLAYSTALIGVAIVVGAGLSFLGLGVQPPEADWGLMVAEGQNVLREAPHVTIIPGLFISLMAVAFNLLGDGVRDLLDPGLRA